MMLLFFRLESNPLRLLPTAPLISRAKKILTYKLKILTL